MGIRFLCPACTKKINVKDHQAGKRGFCPKCGARIDIPLTSLLPPKRRSEFDDDAGDAPPHDRPPVALDAPTIVDRPAVARYEPKERVQAAAQPSPGNAPAKAPVVGKVLSAANSPATDPLAEFPNYQWYVMPAPGGNPFGPADAATMRQWKQEGRIAGTAMVWRQDWPEWRAATSVWAELATASAAPASAPAASAPPAQPTPQAAPQGRLLGQYGSPQPAAAPAYSPVPAAMPQAPVRAAPLATPYLANPAGMRPAAGPVYQQAPPAPEAPRSEIYYPQRSNGTYLAIVVMLVLVVAGLAVLMWFVITKYRPGEERAQAVGETQELNLHFAESKVFDRDEHDSRNRENLLKSIPSIG